MPTWRFKIHQMIPYIFNVNHSSWFQLLMYFLDLKSLIKVGNFYFTLKFNTNPAYFSIITWWYDWPFSLFVCRIYLITVVNMLHLVIMVLVDVCYTPVFLYLLYLYIKWTCWLLNRNFLIWLWINTWVFNLASTFRTEYLKQIWTFIDLCQSNTEPSFSTVCLNSLYYFILLFEKIWSRLWNGLFINRLSWHELRNRSVRYLLDWFFLLGFWPLSFFFRLWNLSSSLNLSNCEIIGFWFQWLHARLIFKHFKEFC